MLAVLKMIAITYKQRGNFYHLGFSHSKAPRRISQQLTIIMMTSEQKKL